MNSPKASPTLVINEKVNAMWAAGQDVLHLGFGESRFPVHPILSASLTENVSRRSYLPAIGTASLRSVVSNFYSEKLNLNFSQEQVLVGVGSKSLLFAMVHSIEGDILLPKPSWVSYSSIAKLTGKKIIRFDLDRKNDFALNIDYLESAYRTACLKGSNPKILILNSPNNPIGICFSPEMIESAALWARNKNLFILSDEIYSLVIYKGFTHQSPAHFYPEKTIIFGGLSKHLSLGGWRVGISILPNNKEGKQLGSSFQSIAGSIWSCVPAPIQATAELAFSGNSDIDHYIQTCTEIHRIRTTFVHQALSSMGLTSPKPTGAFYLYPSFKKWANKLEKMGINSCNDLSLHLLDQFGIATLPGSAFGDDTNNLCLRLSTSFLDMETDNQAQDVLDRFDSGINPGLFMSDHHPRTKTFLNRMGEFLYMLN